MVLVQKWVFFSTFFLGNIDQEIVFYDILELKSAFIGYKTRSPKSRKIDNFREGLTLYSPEKCVLRYSRRENGLLGY